MRFYSGDPANVSNGLSRTVDNAAAGASSRVRLRTTVAHLFSTNDYVTVSGVTGTIEANGTWKINVIDSTHFDLIGTTFTNAYVSGGTAVDVALTPYGTLPDDGEFGTAVSIEAFIQMLADRTQFIERQISRLTQPIYPVARQVLYSSGVEIPVSSATKVYEDPAARNAGAQAIDILTTSTTFDCQAGDIFEVSYAVEFYLFSAGTANSDFCTCALFHANAAINGNFLMIDRRAQETGGDPNGHRFTVTTAIKDISFVRSGTFVVGSDIAAGAKKVSLIGAYDSYNDGKLLQGSMLSVAQYRPVTP